MPVRAVFARCIRSMFWWMHLCWVSSRSGFAAQVAEERSAWDAIQMVKSLEAGSAFVWGLVDVTVSPTKPSPTDHGRWNAGRQGTAFTDEALRRAIIHLRQVVPDNMDVEKTHSDYQRALQRVFAGFDDARLQMMVSPDLPRQLLNRYVQAVRRIREELGERKLGVFSAQSAVLQGLGLATLDSEIDHLL
jgi:hypothetical protein